MIRRIRRLVTCGLFVAVLTPLYTQALDFSDDDVRILRPPCLTAVVPWVTPDSEVLDIAADNDHVYVLFPNGVAALDHGLGVTETTMLSALYGSFPDSFFAAHVGLNAFGEILVLNADGSRLIVIHPHTWRQTTFATNLVYPSRFLVLRRGGIVVSPGRGLALLSRQNGLVHDRALEAGGVLPTALTQGADGRIGLFDAASQRIELRNLEGNLVDSVSVGRPVTGLMLPHALVHLPDDGWILGEPGTLRILNASGETQATTSSGPDGAGLPEYYRLCADPDGQWLFLLEPRTNRVLRAPIAAPGRDSTRGERVRIGFADLDPWCRQAQPPLQARQRVAKARGFLLLRAAESAEAMLRMNDAERRYGQAAEALAAARRLDPLDHEIPAYAEQAIVRRAFLRDLFAEESGLHLTVEQTGVAGSGEPIVAISAEAEGHQDSFDLVLFATGYSREPVRIADVQPRELRRSLPLSDWIPRFRRPLLREHHTVPLQILIVPPGTELPLSDERGCEVVTVDLVVGGTFREVSRGATAIETE